MASRCGILVEVAPYRGWAATWIRHGPLALILVPQVGGRIMGIRWHNEELTFVNPEYQGKIQNVANVADLRKRKLQLGFLLWGGDKTWLAPQHRWTGEVPFIDLDSGTYQLMIDKCGGTATMISPVCRETGVQIERTIELGENPGHWRVTHTLRNHSDSCVSWAPWVVTMLLRPATVYLPVGASSRFPQGLRTFVEEGESARVRDQVVRFVDGFAVVSCQDPFKFKYGVDAEVGSIVAVIEGGPRGLTGYRKSVPTYHPRPYAHGCVSEVFNASVHPYFELELHGPEVTLAPGETFSLVEGSALFDLGQPMTDAASVWRYLRP